MPSLVYVLFAQAAATAADSPWPSAAVWTGFISSGGVLAWFLWKYLPRKDQEVREWIASKDKQIVDVTDKLVEAFEREQGLEREQCNRHFERILSLNSERFDRLDRQLEGLGEAMEALRRAA